MFVRAISLVELTALPFVDKHTLRHIQSLYAHAYALAMSSSPQNAYKDTDNTYTTIIEKPCFLSSLSGYYDGGNGRLMRAPKRERPGKFDVAAAYVCRFILNKSTLQVRGTGSGAGFATRSLIKSVGVQVLRQMRLAQLDGADDLHYELYIIYATASVNRVTCMCMGFEFHIG